MNVLRIATININAIQNETRVAMLQTFIRAQDIDVVLLQEVVSPESIEMPGYVAYSNIGSNMRGTAILSRRNLNITNLERIPSGRAIALECNGYRIVNVYAPSGTAKRTEREQFYNCELSVLLAKQSNPTIIGGDFNCTLAPSDSTGTVSHSNALANVISGLRFTDAWNQDPRRPAYTHQTAHGATRIDRFYLSQEAKNRKVGIETVPVAFTDHHAVIIRMQLTTEGRRRKNGRWKMNPAVVTGKQFTEALQSEWKKWTERKRYYPQIGAWWERCVKVNVRKLARQIEYENNRTHKMMEEHLYNCLNDIIKANIPETERHVALNKYKAKIVRLNAQKREKLLLDTQPKDRMEGEKTSLYQILRINKRRAAREIATIQDEQGRIQNTFQGIAKTMVQYYAKAFQSIQTDNQAIQLLKEYITPVDPNKYKTQLEQSITAEEVYKAICTGNKRKAPGIDGICLEFYETHWQIIQTDLIQLMNDMFQNKNITERQKRGILISIPKNNHAKTMDEYRPITLLTTEYKLLARIMANRLKPIVEEHLSTGQYCGVPGRSIFDALTTIRDIVAYHEVTEKPICLMSIDFQKAFDRVSHEYLFKILEGYGISEAFIEKVKGMYANMSTMIQINGNMVGPIQITSGIRQGCPLSMCLFTLCLHPLLRRLEERLPKLTIGKNKMTSTVIAYADDVTVFVKDTKGFQTILDALKIYENASGARMNTQKSAAMAIAGWKTTTAPLNIPITDSIHILGIRYRPTATLTRDDNWARMITTIRTQARKEYARTLCLEHRIKYAITYLLAKIWFVAQVLQLKKEHAQQLTTTCQWFIWQAAIFRVPMTTMQRPRTDGGWDIPNIDNKCRTLLYTRIRDNINKGEQPIANIDKTWGISRRVKNPPALYQDLRKLEYIQMYIRDMAYINNIENGESQRMIKKRIYRTLQEMSTNGVNNEMRITRKNPGVIWHRVWRNLHKSGLAPSMKSTWYAAINDILPTQNRLRAINLVKDDKCPRCKNTDSVLHRIIECRDGEIQWAWTRQKIAHILRTEAKHIPQEWTIRPDYQIWPKQRNAAVTWIVAHYVFYRLQSNRQLSLRDYTEYMKRARWEQATDRNRGNTGRYLEVIEWTYPW